MLIQIQDSDFACTLDNPILQDIFYTKILQEAANSPEDE